MLLYLSKIKCAIGRRRKLEKGEEDIEEEEDKEEEVEEEEEEEEECVNCLRSDGIFEEEE